jgi:hypothetical protein
MVPWRIHRPSRGVGRRQYLIKDVITPIVRLALCEEVIVSLGTYVKSLNGGAL